MQDIKLWKVADSPENPTITNVSAAVQTDTEELLEDILTRAPDLLSDGLKIVGRQVETPSGPLDLLGIDENGQLAIFELKRGTLTRDAVAQVLDYGSYFASLSPVDLSTLVVEASGKHGVEKISDFSDWYEIEFGKSLETFPNPDLVLVGLGVDERAKRMVEFLAGSKVQMSLITFHGFRDGNSILLARQVEVSTQQSRQRTSSKAANLELLLRRLKTAKLEGIFDHIASTFRDILDSPVEWPNRTGYTYYMQDLSDVGAPVNRAYISISAPDNPKGSLLLSVQERAAKAASEKWPVIAKVFAARLIQRKGYYDVKFSSEKDWYSVEEAVKSLCEAIVIGRKKAIEHKIAAERQGANEETAEPPPS